MFKSLNLCFVSPNVNCTIWCMEAIRLAWINNAILAEKASEARKSVNKRAVLIPAEWFQNNPRYNDDIELFIEFVGIKNNSLTGKEEEVYRFIKKVYSTTTFTYNSEEFTIPTEDE